MTVLWALLSGFATKVGEWVFGRIKTFKTQKRPIPATTTEKFMMQEIKELKKRVKKNETANAKCERKNDRCERKNALLERRYFELRTDLNNFLLRSKGDKLSKTASMGAIFLGRFFR